MANNRAPISRRKVVRVALLVVALLSPPLAAHAQIDVLLQPRGTVISGLPGFPSMTTGADANAYLGIPPPTEPFDNTRPAGVVRTTQPTEYYVRLYTPPNSNAAGPWVMRASTVRGLTPEQLRDRFALPFLPTFITNVLIPSGTCLLSGIAGPITGNFAANPPAIPSAGPWGNGGAQQTRLVGVDNSTNCTSTSFVPSADFINRREIGANALWYAPIVRTGNPAAVGAYLDHLPAPAEYSDLYNVYSILDVLNDGTPTTLRPALRELSGESHAAATIIALGNAERFARLLTVRAAGVIDDDWGGVMPSAVSMYAAAPFGDRSITSHARWWVAGSGRFGRVGGDDDQSGYRFNTGQGVLGYDYRPGSNWIAGAALAAELTGLSVDGPSNSATLTTLRGGTYAAIEISRTRFAASMLASWDHYDTSRSLPTFSRTASASYEGYTLAVSAVASRKIPLGFAVIEPLVGLGLARLWRPAFSESGANALSLRADTENATKLTSRIGATLTKPIMLDSGKLLRPWLRAFWAHDFLDTQGELVASLAGATAPGTFTINTANPGRDAALVGAGATLDINPASAVTVAYDGEWGRNTDIHSVSASATMRW